GGTRVFKLRDERRQPAVIGQPGNIAQIAARGGAYPHRLVVIFQAHQRACQVLDWIILPWKRSVPGGSARHSPHSSRDLFRGLDLEDALAGGSAHRETALI